MRKVLQDTTSSAYFISLPTNNKFDKSVRYIPDNNSWERCYVLLKILFPRLRVLRLADSNCAGMEKVYYYLRMTKQCIEKKTSDIDHQKPFPDMLSPANTWNESDGESDKEELI